MTPRTTHSEAETAAVGRELGATLRCGAVVLLEGTLGAGKTAFVRGLAEGLGADPDGVSSPTFTIVQEYSGRETLQHIDLYRLSPIEVDDLSLDDVIDGSVAAIEWPDRWRNPPAHAVRVSIDVVDPATRRIEIEKGVGSLFT